MGKWGEMVMRNLLVPGPRKSVKSLSCSMKIEKYPVFDGSYYV